MTPQRTIDAATHPMHCWLASAVPAALDTVAGWNSERRVKQAEGYADTIACGADVLWADTAAAARAEISPEQVREAISHGLAILAHRPGGVSFAGLHWHTRPDCEDCPGPGVWNVPGAETDRATRGAFFTPRSLAEEVVHYAVGPHLAERRHEDIVSLRIADIACGCGAFLLAATRQVADALTAVWDDFDRDYFTAETLATSPSAAARLIALECLYGVDLDPLSVEMARLALQLLVPDDQLDLWYRVRLGDSLVGRTHPDWDLTDTFPHTPHRFDWPTAFPDVFASPGDVACGFDAVIGNPPYLGGQKLTGALGVAYREHLIRAIAGGRRGSVDLAVYFWLRAHELVNEFGTVGIVGPANLDRGANQRAWLDHLTSYGWFIYRDEPLRRWPSRSAAVSCRILYTVRRRFIPPRFLGYDAAAAVGLHTCDFAFGPPLVGEPRQPRPDCPRCQDLAIAGAAVLRIQVAGQPYEIVREPPDPPLPPPPGRTRTGQSPLFDL